MMRELNLALIHLGVRHKEPARNRKELLSLVERAARQGADLVVAPELALSGYSFQGHDDIDPFAETGTGPTVTALIQMALDYGVFICFGMAERDDPTGIIFNSAFVLGPDGSCCCRYRKINSESRWACPGDPKADNTFETPWGRMGVLICSDSYHGLMPRATALRGAVLFLIPSTWPPSGLDPRLLWRARAIENGCYVVACNRTGTDLTMDCRQASTCICDPEGRMLLDVQSDHSQIYFTGVPLNSMGLLDNGARQRRMTDRRPQHYRGCYRNLRAIRNLTGFLNLPQPGILDIHCIVPKEDEHPTDALRRTVTTIASSGGALLVLPLSDYSDAALEIMTQIALSNAVSLVACRSEATGQCSFSLHHQNGVRLWHLPPWPFDDDVFFPEFNHGPASIRLVPFAALAHPELAVSFAKHGCDLALAFEETLSPEQRLLAGARTIENLAVAVCAANGAGIWLPPDGHHSWREFSCGPGEVCHCKLNTHHTRDKNFQDRIDFELLFRKSVDADP